MKNKRTDTTSSSKWFSVHIFKMNKKKKIISWDYLCLSFTLWFGMSKTLETCILYVKRKMFKLEFGLDISHSTTHETLYDFLRAFKKKKKKSRNFTIMNNNYILRGKNIKAVQIAMTTIQPVMIHEYTVYLCYIYIHVYIKYMPKFQLIYIISHMRWKNSTCTHKKIKRTLKFMKVIHKYIYLIFSLHKAYYLHDQKMADEVQTQ